MNSDASKCATCGLWVEDPLHASLHYLKEWNTDAFKRARAIAEKEFEARLKKEDRCSSPRSSKSAPTMFE